MTNKIRLIDVPARAHQRSWRLPAKGHTAVRRQALPKAAYKCDPILDAHRTCLELVADRDICIEWNGGDNPEDLIVMAGNVKSEFGNGTITILQDQIWKPVEEYYLLIGPQPNSDFDDQWRMLDALIKPNYLHYPFFPVIKFRNSGKHSIAEGIVLGAVRLLPPFDTSPITEVVEDYDYILQYEEKYRLMRQRREVPTNHYRKALRQRN